MTSFPSGTRGQFQAGFWLASLLLVGKRERLTMEPQVPVIELTTSDLCLIANQIRERLWKRLRIERNRRRVYQTLSREFRVSMSSIPPESYHWWALRSERESVERQASEAAANVSLAVDRLRWLKRHGDAEVH
jgi:hypothetical protein